MMIKRTLIILAISTLLIVSPLYAQVSEQGFREDFNSLDNWKPLTFPRIPRHSAYRIQKEGENNFSGCPGG